MSDFIFSKRIIKQGELAKKIKTIYHDDGPQIKEFHGEWGSLAVSENLYNYFQPYETREHICVVIGGPLLCFDYNFQGSDTSTKATEAIYKRMIEGTLKWDEDLSGPYIILLINKKSKEVECITDLMSFIPLYCFKDNDNIMLSTHVDVLARASNQEEIKDLVSKVDFILNGVVTYPYTAYTHIRQVAPASKHTIKANNCELISRNYWIPKEEYMYKSINQAATDLRKGLQDYINKVTKNFPHIAQFISGGEDSRTLSGLLPKEIKRDAFIFLDHMNLEGKLAKKAANAYGVNFNMFTRSKIHYLEILPSCTDLVGSGSQYIHVHTFGFHKSCKLNEYPAVFGGFLSDTLLKGHHIKKMGELKKFPFLPQIKARNYSSYKAINNSFFTSEVLVELNKRRNDHFEYIKTFRKDSTAEWFNLWPISMHNDFPNLHGNRRLFSSYEPFMSKDVVKISASVPQKWKLNRRLFHRAVKPLLKPTKWLLHGDGRLPYFPWYINSFVQFIVWFIQQISVRTGKIKGNQGSWGEWSVIMNSPEWYAAIENYSDGINELSSALTEKDIKKIFDSHILTIHQRVNLLQTLYENHYKRY